MRWGLDELSSTHAAYRPMRPTVVPRVILRVGNQVTGFGRPSSRKQEDAPATEQQKRPL